MRHGKDGPLAEDVNKDEIVVQEDGQPVTDLEIFQPKAQGLTAVLAMDISGSMESHNKIVEARKAANLFLDKLDPRSDSGLILFDHLLRVKEPPGRDPSQFAAHRVLLHQKVDAAKPSGGTAYLDATAEGLRMLQDIPGRRAVVLMTDGVDMNSTQTQKQVIELAKASHVPIYTIGIGDPGKNEQVTTVLVLDHSGSMAAKASDADDEAEDPGAARGGVAVRGADAADGRDDAVAVQQRHRQAAAVQLQQGGVEGSRSGSCSRTAARCCTTRRFTAWRRWRRRGGRARRRWWC